jgi:hypothetical protein
MNFKEKKWEMHHEIDQQNAQYGGILLQIVNKLKYISAGVSKKFEVTINFNSNWLGSHLGVAGTMHCYGNKCPKILPRAFF